MDEEVAQRIREFDAEPWIPPRLKKGLKRYGLATLLLLAAVGLVLWQRHVSAPSPKQICAHKIELTRAETQKSAHKAAARLIEKLQVKCQESAERRIRLEGKIAYARFARCVMAAKTLSETERC